MRTEIHINTALIPWAINRAGFDLHEFLQADQRVQLWLDGKKLPTVKQLETFAKKVFLPFGYLFLQEPPREEIPFPFFRTALKENRAVNINVYDTILLLKQRQDWLREYLQENEFRQLTFTKRYNGSQDIAAIVENMRAILDLPEDWARQMPTWPDALDHLAKHIENIGIITVFNGVVENNNTRKIPVDECRGFVMVDDWAPFMFVNNADSKAAQMFTLAHELAHVWIGSSAGFDFRNMQPANDPTELLCDRIAAEFLVPEQSFRESWRGRPDIANQARHYKVSPIVIARRAQDLGFITRTQFLEFYNAYILREFTKKEAGSSGGDFYATSRKRISVTFASHINNALKSGKLLHRDAYRLTGLRGDTFETFFTKYL